MTDAKTSKDVVRAGLAGLAGIFVGWVTNVGLMAALYFTRTPVPEFRLFTPIYLFSLAVAALVAGLVASLIYRFRSLRFSVAMSFLWFAASSVASIAVSWDADSPSVWYWPAIVGAAFILVGSFLGQYVVNRTAKNTATR